MGRGHKCDFASSSGSTPTLYKIAIRQHQGPADVRTYELRTVDGVPVGNRAERRMAERQLRRENRGGAK